MSTMEISVAENYHKLLGHLTVAGDEVVVSLGQKLSTSRILNGDDIQKINDSSSVKDKVKYLPINQGNLDYFQGTYRYFTFWH